jgi:hypothetical protein
MTNKYLRDKAMRRSGRSDRMDGRNPYGSRGGYVRDRADMARGRSNRGRGYDRAMDFEHDYAERGGSDYRRYDRRYDDEAYDRNYEYDREHYGRDYAEEEMDKEYEEKLHEWIKKLKKKDRFATSKEDIIRKAKSMDVKFDEFNEDEFYAVYLMMVSDYKMVANDPHHYLAMAKEWLMDDDVEMTGSDKVCAYLYTIVLGETE